MLRYGMQHCTPLHSKSRVQYENRRNEKQNFGTQKQRRRLDRKDGQQEKENERDATMAKVQEGSSGDNTLNARKQNTAIAFTAFSALLCSALTVVAMCFMQVLQSLKIGTPCASHLNFAESASFVHCASWKSERIPVMLVNPVTSLHQKRWNPGALTQYQHLH